MFIKKEDVYFAAATKHSTIRNHCASPWAAAKLKSTLPLSSFNEPGLLGDIIWVRHQVYPAFATDLN